MSGKVSIAWLLLAGICLSSCGGSTTSQYEDPPPSAPVGLSYTDPNLFTMGVTIPTLVPTISGGKPSSYGVEPPLPAGLVLDGDGNISGTPTEPRSPETYLVTASNASGSSLFGVRITVQGRYSVGGLVQGLKGTGLVLTNNGADNLAISTNGSFVFARTFGAASVFSVAVATQPTGQTCSVISGANGSLTNENYNGAVVNCTDNMSKMARGGSPVVSAKVLNLRCFEASAVEGVIIDQGTGVITPLGDVIYQFQADALSPMQIQCGPNSVITDADGRWLFVRNIASNLVSVYAAGVTR